MKKYNLEFISDQNLYEHVKTTVLKYRFHIDLAEFNKNLLDPIKLTFDAKVYKKTIEATLEAEIIRQMDKSNTNHIGYFHQNIFHYFGHGWTVPIKGYDIINTEQRIYVEMKNKHNTMNSSSSQKTYMRMQNTLLKDSKALCYLVEVIASKSQNIVWKTSLDNLSVSNERIRRISIDQFYALVTGQKQAFKQLCAVLPTIIADVVDDIKLNEASNTVIDELKHIDKNLLNSVYLLSFKTYEGFDDFHV
ncbi:MAG: Eco47II family restriction endonuclease [Methylococcaceae bacterium]|nr:MAG: Eco47II family restriction endonuclease [Methylococcaceae bacterium]